MQKKLKFKLKDTDNIIYKLKNLDKKCHVALEINLLKKKNHNDFFKMQAKLQKENPNLFPMELKLNEELDDTAIFYIDGKG